MHGGEGVRRLCQQAATTGAATLVEAGRVVRSRDMDAHSHWLPRCHRLDGAGVLSPLPPLTALPGCSTCSRPIEYSNCLFSRLACLLLYSSTCQHAYLGTPKLQCNASVCSRLAHPQCNRALAKRRQPRRQQGRLTGRMLQIWGLDGRAPAYKHANGGETSCCIGLRLRSSNLPAICSSSKIAWMQVPCSTCRGASQTAG